MGVYRKISWLHVSDFHFKGGDPYDRDVVLNALVRSVKKFGEIGRQPDLIFATGDVAHSGAENEYQTATAFFDALCAAAGVEKQHLFVIPGNHDVDRALEVGLARTLITREEADIYSGQAFPKGHILQKQRAFLQWHDRYFDGIRTFPINSTCGPVQAVEVKGCKIGILPVNSALSARTIMTMRSFRVGRRCIDPAIEAIEKLNADLKIALVHHPLDWLHDAERANIRTALQSGVDLIMYGHLHETDIERVAGVMGDALHMVAGAAYQTRQWPNRALYEMFRDGGIEVYPIRYEDQPRPLWTTDPSVFPFELNHTKRFAVPRLSGTIGSRHSIAGECCVGTTDCSTVPQHDPFAPQPAVRQPEKLLVICKPRSEIHQEMLWSSSMGRRASEERTGAGVRAQSTRRLSGWNIHQYEAGPAGDRDQFGQTTRTNYTLTRIYYSQA